MQVEIHTAGLDDAFAISGVICQSITACCVADHRGDPETITRWLSNKTPENIRKWMVAPGSTGIVARQSGSVRGFAFVCAEQLALCYVVPQALHQGVGKALLKAAEAQALSRGVDMLRLDSTRTALPFYIRNGYSACGAPRRWAGLEAQPMRKRLADPAIPLGASRCR